MAYKTNLTTKDADFASMMEGGFGIVTVMNAKVYEAEPEVYLGKTAYGIVEHLEAKEALCELDTLKIANVTQEGPTKTITGGKYSNALLKFGKSARLEMQDALGSAKAIEYLCGGIREWNGGLNNYVNGLSGLHFGEDFQGPKTIVGESFFIDRETGRQIDVKIIFYQFSPDSIFNLTQDAEGDATVFDMNGDLLTTEILLGTDEEDETKNTGVPHGVFYSILPVNQTTNNDPEIPEDSSVFPGVPEGWSISIDSENFKNIEIMAHGFEYTISGTNGEGVITGNGTIDEVKNGTGYVNNIEPGEVYYVKTTDDNIELVLVVGTKKFYQSKA